MTTIAHTSFVCLRARIAEIFPGEVRNLIVQDVHHEGGDRTGRTAMFFAVTDEVTDALVQYNVIEQNYPVASAVDTDFDARWYDADTREWRTVGTFDDLDDALEVLAEGFLGTGV
jgi:hypothetical protein